MKVSVKSVNFPEDCRRTLSTLHPQYRRARNSRLSYFHYSFFIDFLDLMSQSPRLPNSASMTGQDSHAPVPRTAFQPAVPLLEFNSGSVVIATSMGLMQLQRSIHAVAEAVLTYPLKTPHY
jgi:hypothetical protein